MKKRSSEQIFDFIVYTVVTFVVILTLYPLIYVLSMSISSSDAVLKGKVLFYPIGFSLNAYKVVFSSKEIWTCYYNTLWYTVVGTCLNVFFTVLMAYPLSKKKFFARNFFMIVMVITMFFNGGLIPLYVLVVKLGLYGKRMAVILPTLILAWNVIISRTFFQTLPEDLFENARLEGASERQILTRIVVPLSKPIIAVLVLFYGISHWNSFFPALLYLPDPKLHPIQVYLRRVLIQYNPESLVKYTRQVSKENFLSLLQVKYSIIIVAILPIVTLYPFLQKYFVKGVMIGALKG